MKSKDITQLSVKEMESKVHELQDKLLDLRIRKQTGRLEKPHEFKTVRRTIARLETFIAQKRNS